MIMSNSLFSQEELKLAEDLQAKKKAIGRKVSYSYLRSEAMYEWQGF